ncbi:PilW family protein [Ramlibacter rhizophilus]|uniref:Prepilin-type N-terminal cleavage/methylation domain-containing protein n=1 Tax=Ramlibacter rhizophilus TaxID=1781167 RepID=A0A4Z0BZ77_9BURK|nr:PilW family protein [Ramlibacter rhizophilus]TFZ04657.1 hypothetical protein EZ242_02595 [Ramlibacter rhizophilus]
MDAHLRSAFGKPARALALSPSTARHQRPRKAGSASAREPAPAFSQRGVGLVELMVALLLGLLVIGGVLSIYLSNRVAYRDTEQLARLQENARFAFDLLMREARDTGLSPCGSPLRANVLRTAGNPTVAWWADTDAGFVRGYDGTEDSAPIVAFGNAAAQRASGTDAVLLLRPGGAETGYGRIASHDAAAPAFTLADKGGLESDDLVLLCDAFSASLLQVGALSGSALAYGAAPYLNCSTSLGSLAAGCTQAQDKTFASGALLVRWDPAFWYVGTNSRGGRSLYRRGLQKSKTTAPATIDVVPEEIIPGVADMQIDYLTRAANGSVSGPWRTAKDFAGLWNNPAAEVIALRVRLTLASDSVLGTDGKPLSRQLVAVAALRNAVK